MRRLLAGLFALALVSSCSGDDDTDGRSTPAPTSPTPTTTAPDPTSASSAAPTTTLPPDLDAVSVKLTEVASGLESPVAFAVRSGDDRFYVAEQPGRVRVIDDGKALDASVLEIDVSDGNEQGLLGLTFSTDGTKLYVDYTDPGGDTHVDEYTMSGDVADPATRREVLLVDQPFPNHNGGQVTIGPDGLLYVTLGDGGAAGDPDRRAQNLQELLGKILRIDPTPSGDSPYTVPADNPFVGRADARNEIWMWGLRNPWRFSFDRANNDVWIGDVGQGTWEEIDYSPAGESGINWGWDSREGAHDFEGPAPEGARDPIFELSHADGNCSVTGGYVYRGAAIAALRGAYVFADYCVGDVLAITQTGGALGDQRELGVHVDEVTSFGEGADGELYVLSRPGSIYRIDPA